MNQDLEHLKLLAIFHYVLAGMTALGSLLPVFHLVIGLALLSGNLGNGPPPPPEVGYFFVGIAGFFILTGLTIAAFLFFAGRCLARQRHYGLCFCVAAVSCLFMPLGTVLGVFTLVVLSRDTVKQCFAGTLPEED